MHIIISNGRFDVCFIIIFINQKQDPFRVYHQPAERFFNRVVKTNLFQLGSGGGRCKAPAGSGAEPRRQADFDNNLLKMN